MKRGTEDFLRHFALGMLLAIAVSVLINSFAEWCVPPPDEQTIDGLAARVAALEETVRNLTGDGR